MTVGCQSSPLASQANVAFTNLLINMLDKWNRDKAGFTPDHRFPKCSVPADHDTITVTYGTFRGCAKVRD